MEQRESTQSDWLPSSIREQMLATDDEDLHTAVTSVSSEITELVDANSDTRQINLDFENPLQSDQLIPNTTDDVIDIEKSAAIASPNKPEKIINLTDDIRNRILRSFQNKETTASNRSNLTDTQLIDILSTV